MFKITPEDFKEFFSKDFNFGDEKKSQVSDTDIERAILEAKMDFNEMLFDTDETKKLMYLYLTAYYLVVDINNRATKGATNNGGLLNFRQVRNVAESFKVPKWIEENPMFSMYAQNGYGLKYITMLQPYLVGQMFVVVGRTLP